MPLTPTVMHGSIGSGSGSGASRSLTPMFLLPGHAPTFSAPELVVSPAATAAGGASQRSGTDGAGGGSGSGSRAGAGVSGANPNSSASPPRHLNLARLAQQRYGAGVTPSNPFFFSTANINSADGSGSGSGSGSQCSDRVSPVLGSPWVSAYGSGSDHGSPMPPYVASAASTSSSNAASGVAGVMRSVTPQTIAYVHGSTRTPPRHPSVNSPSPESLNVPESQTNASASAVAAVVDMFLVSPPPPHIPSHMSPRHASMMMNGVTATTTLPASTSTSMTATTPPAAAAAGQMQCVPTTFMASPQPPSTPPSHGQ